MYTKFMHFKSKINVQWNFDYKVKIYCFFHQDEQVRLEIPVHLSRNQAGCEAAKKTIRHPAGLDYGHQTPEAHATYDFLRISDGIVKAYS